MIIIIIKAIVSVVVVSLRNLENSSLEMMTDGEKNESYQKDLFSVFDQTFSIEAIGAKSFSQKSFGRQTLC